MYGDDEDCEAFRNGWMARENDVDGNANPYSETAQAYSHAQWDSGWCRCYNTYKHHEEGGPVPRPWEAP
jgi:hypothetical protein